MSRNKLEGEYVGCVQGKHVRVGMSLLRFNARYYHYPSSLSALCIMRLQRGGK